MAGRRASAAALTVEGLTRLGVSSARAPVLQEQIASALEASDPLQAWRLLSKQVLRPEDPFEVHDLAHRLAFAEWDSRRGPAPAWVPSDEEIARSNLGRVMDGDYLGWHRKSVAEPERYWAAMLERLRIVADRPPERILDASTGAEEARWLPGMRLNIARSALERDGDRTAVVWKAEGSELERRTLAELRRDCALVAAALDQAGFGPADAIAIDMPMTYEAVVLYLAIVSLGAQVVSIADSFAPAEIATRLRIAGARAIFTQDVILRGGKTLPLYERVVEANAPRAFVVAAGEELAVALRSGDRSYRDLLRSVDTPPEAPAYASAAIDAPTNILFSSGTTGDPKAIPWTHLTPIKAAADGWAHQDIRPGGVVAWPTNLGWMMGPWLIYASLLNDAAIALYEGSPGGRDFGQFVQDASVTMLGVVPSLVKTWRDSGCMDGLDWSAIRCFSSTGEPSSRDEMLWLMARAGYAPVIEYCGGTEIGGGYITGTVVQPQAPATFSTPALGCDFVIIDEHGDPADSGELALVAPMLGSSSKLLNRDHHEVYFAGMPRGPNGQVLRRHGDHMERLGGGYLRALGRVDDTMNLGGIKVSSAEIERVCNQLPGITETAAIAVPPPGGGPSRLVVVAVLSPGQERESAELQRELSAAIRQQLNPLFKVNRAVIVEALPRTASNKVMRRVLRDQLTE
ncbi:MAG: AMP-binding protein [Deltaproteobacteria bacterium]|jgi:acetyl-CoA synthetase|nr:AMP-binding protein [Deltaproteobacteria bacterium]MBW2534381.1 AMP-binding protein [Deltaproteobacteria bacterium]